MKKPILFVIFGLVILFTVSNKISAQDKQIPQPTLDQQIKTAEEENLKLKKLKAIQDENKRLKSELGIEAPETTLRQKNGDPAGGNPPETTQTETAVLPAASTEAKSGPNLTEPEKATKDKTDDKTNSSDSNAETVSPLNSAGSPTMPQGNLDLNCGGDEDRKDSSLCLLAIQILQQNGSTITSGLAFQRVHSSLVTKALIERVFPVDATLDSQASRTDKQIGSDVKGVGTTSLVAKGGIPLIMSFATENGAAVSSVSGTTMSFRFNPVGLVEFLTAGSTHNLTPAPPPSRFTNFLRRTAIGLSYDISRGVPTPTFTGSRDQFSGASFRYEFVDQRSPTAKKAQDLTKSFISEVGVPYDTLLVNALRAMYSDTETNIPAEIKDFRDNVLLKAVTDNIPKIGTKDIQKRSELLYDVLASAFAKAPVDAIKKNALLFGAAKQFADAMRGYQTAEENLQRRLKTGTLFTFDYNYSRSFTASDTSNFRLIYEKGWENGTDFTVNGSATIFHRPTVSIPLVPPAIPGAEQKRFRDFSFAAQFDLPLTALGGSFKASTLSVAAKYQRMNTDSVVLFDGTQVNGIKGKIFLGQAKLLLPVGKTGLFFPISFTYANRTELIREKKSRGNFGFTFDFSSLLEKYLSP